MLAIKSSLCSFCWMKVRDSSRFILCDLGFPLYVSLFPKAKLFEVAPDSLSKGDSGKKEEKLSHLLWGAQIMPAERRKRPSSRGRDSSSDASRCAMVTHQMNLPLDVTRIRPTCARENLVMRISSLEIVPCGALRSLENWGKGLTMCSAQTQQEPKQRSEQKVVW